jgi:hypothetical protein
VSPLLPSAWARRAALMTLAGPCWRSASCSVLLSSSQRRAASKWGTPKAAQT